MSSAADFVHQNINRLTIAVILNGISIILLSIGMIGIHVHLNQLQIQKRIESDQMDASMEIVNPATQSRALGY